MFSKLIDVTITVRLSFFFMRQVYHICFNSFNHLFIFYSFIYPSLPLDIQLSYYHRFKIGVFCLFVFLRQASLCIPGCPGTLFVKQVGLELRDLTACASQVLGLKHMSPCLTQNRSPLFLCVVVVQLADWVFCFLWGFVCLFVVFLF